MTPQVDKYTHLNMTTSQYVCAHQWVKRHYGKANKCDECGRLNAVRYEWSNISKLYKRVREDWRMLCTTCHRKFDYTKEQRASISLRSSKPVTQRSINGWTVKEYPSAKVASLETGISRTAIQNNLSGRTKTAGGYVWQH